MKDLPTANDIKVNILSWAVAQLKGDEAIASELRFLDGERRADLAIVSRDRLTAIEVKGPRDNLTTLQEQISSYLDMFLDVYVATSTGHLSEVRALIPRAVGLIAADSGKTEIVRASTPRKRLSKESWAGWLLRKDFDELHRLLSTSRNDDIQKLRRSAVAQLDHGTLQQFSLSQILRRVLTRHDAFVGELGQTMTLDDVRMLTIERKIRP